MEVADVQDVFSNIHEPLREYALGELPAQSLAHLRTVNKSAQRLVDQHTGGMWRVAASRLVDAACLAPATDPCTVQNILKEQGALLKNLRAGRCLSIMSGYLVVMFLAFSAKCQLLS